MNNQKQAEQDLIMLTKKAYRDSIVEKEINEMLK